MNDKTKDLEEADNRPIMVSPSSESFAFWGVDEVAYVKPGLVDGNSGFVIYCADGQEFGFAPDRDTAVEAALQFDLVPLSVH